MRRMILASMVFAATLSVAQADQVSRCLLAIDGKTFISGPCRYDSSEGGGFGIYTKDWFATVLVYDGEAVGYWNAYRGATHAHTSLGEMTRNGACFINNRARICAWR